MRPREDLLHQRIMQSEPIKSMVFTAGIPAARITFFHANSIFHRPVSAIVEGNLPTKI
jgi:hypothetical protein